LSYTRDNRILRGFACHCQPDSVNAAGTAFTSNLVCGKATIAFIFEIERNNYQNGLICCNMIIIVSQ
jgi:hypothetical protein